MPDYKELYRILFRSQSNAILILQEAQKQTEELYISAEEPELILMEQNKPQSIAVEQKS